MKKLVIALIFVLTLNVGYSQKLDLVINSSGDSIACNIDSITSSHIYIKWKNGRKWEHAYLRKSKPFECQYEAIDKELVVYEPGTPYIKCLKKSVNMDFLKSSISGTFGGALIFYSATIHLEHVFSKKKKKENTTIFGRFGFGVATGLVQVNYISINGGIYAGANNWPIELSAGFGYLLNEKFVFPMISFGWRFQKPNESFIFRTGIGFPEGLYLSVGFRF